MKLTRFYSGWNGMKSSEAYFDVPSNNDIKDAIKNGIVRKETHVILVNENRVEVRTSVKNGYADNNYRDLYIIEE